MIGIIGIAIVFIMVFGGYVIAGGKLGIILKAAPFELIMILGAAVGAFVLANDGATVKHTLKDIGRVFKGPKWGHHDYQDLLCLLFELIRIARSSPVALEEHIENPGESSVFGRYEKIRGDGEAVALICDTLRAASMISCVRFTVKSQSTTAFTTPMLPPTVVPTWAMTASAPFLTISTASSGVAT